MNNVVLKKDKLKIIFIIIPFILIFIIILFFYILYLKHKEKITTLELENKKYKEIINNFKNDKNNYEIKINQLEKNLVLKMNNL